MKQGDSRMKTGRLMPIGGYLLLLLLLAGMIAGCGGSDSDESAPLLTFAGTDPSTTVRSHLLAGEVENGAVVQVTVDTTAEVTGLEVADGQWRCTVGALAPGSNLVTILATDRTGNQSVLLLSLLYDALSIERWVTPIPEGATTIGGLFDPAAVASLKVTVANAPAPVLDVTGDHWKADLSGLLPGDNVVTVSIELDAAVLTKTLTLKVDDAAPVVTIDPVTSPTNANSQAVSGSRTDTLTPTILAPTAEKENLNLDTPAVWSATLAKLQQGKNPFTVSATVGAVTTIARDLIVHDAPPSVVETLPLADAVKVSPASPVRATFSEPLQEATVNNATFNVACQGITVAGTVNYAAGTRTATFTPGGPLPAGDCTATLTAGITDLTGNALSASPWSFTVN
jgi:hypothetical protein